ncbi:hypothetical protein [Moritella yayanosii]|uniref:3-hydroxyisobutyrate dehydrogenase n=1 Tax=Moritella yayanosii TaxID=69539 RepID=A0A330LTJ0_9GAMM
MKANAILIVHTTTSALLAEENVYECVLPVLDIMAKKVTLVGE